MQWSILGRQNNTERNVIQSLQYLKIGVWQSFLYGHLWRLFQADLIVKLDYFIANFMKGRNVTHGKVLKPLILNEKQNPKIWVFPKSPSVSHNVPRKPVIHLNILTENFAPFLFHLLTFVQRFLWLKKDWLYQSNLKNRSYGKSMTLVVVTSYCDIVAHFDG